jgi:cobalt-zinc-cadmium efflux system outer membrane protein
MKKIKAAFLALVFLFPATLLSEAKNEFDLKELIQIGLANNLFISAQMRAIEAKKASYASSKRLINPEIELVVGKAKAYNGIEKRNTGGLRITQPIENPFKRHYRSQARKNDLEAAEYLYQYKRLEIVFFIKNQFYQLLMLEENKDIAQENLKSIQDIYKLIQKRAELGEVKELEAIKLYVETLKAQKELSRLKTEIRLAKDNLNKFLGNALPSDFSVSGQLEYLQISLQEETLLQKTLSIHPLLKQKERILEQTKSNLNFIKWQRLPDFKLSGFSQKELDGKNQGIGISFDIPLWNFKSTEIAEAENLSLKQDDELSALQIEVVTQVKAKLSQFKLSQQTIGLFRTGLLKQAEESLKISEVSYKAGEISLIDFLDSQRTYYSIREDFHEALYNLNADKAALEKAIGEELK